jgi:hypothetical protein
MPTIPHTTPEALEVPLGCWHCSGAITHRPYVKADITVELPREGFGGYRASYGVRNFHPGCIVPTLGGPMKGAVDAVLAVLDGTTASAVSVLTGLSRAELDDLGGFGDEGVA